MIPVSVIIPNYNHAPYLEQRIQSVLSQTYPHFEVIILDDCSTDNSRQVIDRYRTHEKVNHILYNEQNSGSPFLQWKKGIGLAQYDLVWIAESDDFAAPGFLQKAIESVERVNSPCLFYADSFTVNENGDPYEEKFSVKKNMLFETRKWTSSYHNHGVDEINECLKFDCTINNISAVVFSKSLFIANKQVASDYVYYGDWAFIISAAFSAEVYYCNEPLNYYRKHGRSHLNSETSVIVSRHEYFNIFRLLWYNKLVTDKKQLLDHFTYNYLSFGMLHDGLKKGWKIVSYYFRVDRSLALKVVMKLAAIILFRRKRPFYVPATESKK
jgi:glycosyltransferase involved in cell wall biosynthesis